MTPSTPGWLPTAIGRNSQSNQAGVNWLEFEWVPLAEPFFGQTVEKLRRCNPPAREVWTGIDTLIDLGMSLPPVTPSGFIFHVSHCGSTMIANALKLADRAVVISEAPPISILHYPAAESFFPHVDATWDEIREVILRALISLFAHYRTGEPEQVVIKFPSWNILSWSAVRSCWPDVPCVVVIRDPVEVIAASLDRGGWMKFKKAPEVASQLFGWENLPRSVAEMSEEEYAARVLRRYYECAGEVAAAETSRMLDYTDIDVPEIRAIAAFFGLDLSASDDAIQRTLGLYAKDPSGTRPYRQDSAQKQKLATGLVRSAAYQWAAAGYKDLKKNC